MAAALRRLVLPTISRQRPAPRQPLPSFAGAGTGTGAGKTAQGHRLAGDRCTIRSYGTEDAADQERKPISKAKIHLAGALVLWSIYGAILAHEHYWPSARHEHDFPEDDDC